MLSDVSELLPRELEKFSALLRFYEREGERAAADLVVTPKVGVL